MYYRNMLDFETLGRRPGCVVLSLGAVFFSSTAAEPLGPTFYSVVSVEDQKTYDELHVDPDTVAWWSKQDEAARAGVAGAYATEAPPLAEVLKRFSAYLLADRDKRSVQLWGNGADFDNAILSTLYAVAGVEQPWEFYNNRCYRTLKGLVKGPKLQRVGTYHNALDDAKSQALHAVQLLRALGAVRTYHIPDNGLVDPLEGNWPSKPAATGVAENPRVTTAPAEPRYKRKF